MNQRAYFGGRQTLLDVAKGAVETFIKIRQRDPASRGDRYMLLTFEEPPTNIKAGWKENHTVFANELKNLQASGMTTLGAALKNAFDVLNVNRMQTGIDTYGQGRCPFYLEPSVIIVITDGGNLSTCMGVQEDLNLPMHSPIPGSELTKEPFRWDQRLFSLVLRLAGTPSVERDPLALVPSDMSPIDPMCEVTGGRSYCVTSQRMLLQCLESLVQKVQSGVVIHFEKIGPDPPPVPNDSKIANALDRNLENYKPIKTSRLFLAVKSNDDVLDVGTVVDGDILNKKGDLLKPGIVQNGTLPQRVTSPGPITPQPPNNNSWYSCRKLIYVPRSAQKGYSVGHWPIPEAFWPDVNTPALPPRTAHPVVKFTCQNNEPMVIDNLPFDKYELEPSPLTQHILSRKQPTTCWQVFVASSHKNSEVGYPFGYLKASTNLHCVNLFVMPYNYPVLLPLLDELFKVHRLKPTKDWKQQFDNYLKNTPLYYALPLKRALLRMGAPNLVPESMENYLSYSVLNYLKKLKNQAKAEFDKLIASVGTGKPQIPEGIRVIQRSDPRKDLGLSSNSGLSERFISLKEQIADYNGFMISIKDKDLRTQSYRNPFDIPRKALLDQIARMRANYLQTCLMHTRLQDEDQMHNMPVGQMGNYQEYLKRIPPPLREIESQPVRQHMFGNPFKIDKRMMVDEADIDLVGGGGSSPSRGTKRQAEASLGSPRPQKRKPGPLPKDLPIRRPVTPPIITSPSQPGSPSIPSPTLNSEEMIPNSFDWNQRSTLVNGSDSRLSGEVEPERSYAENETNHIDALHGTMELVNHVDDHSLVDLFNLEMVNNKSPKNDGGVNFSTNNNKLDPAIILENTKLRTTVFKELRKPGRNFQVLFEKLNQVQGSLEAKISFIRDIIKEASRFKRKALIQLLENFQQSLMQTSAQTSLCNSKDSSNVPLR